MILLIVKNIQSKYRGTIKNYMLEVKPMVFVGNINSKVRDFLVELCNNYSEEFIMVLDRKNHIQGIEIIKKGFDNIQDICGLYAVSLKNRKIQ